MFLRSLTHVAGRKSKHNWQQIEAEYVEAVSEAARPTLEALAEKYDVSPSHLREQASKGNWKGKAEQYLKSIAQSRQTKKVERVATEQVDWDSRCMNLADLALEQIQTHLQNALFSDGLSTRELTDLVKALEQLHKLGRSIQGEGPAEEAPTLNAEQYSQMSASDLAQAYMERLKRPGAGK